MLQIVTTAVTVNRTRKCRLTLQSTVKRTNAQGRKRPATAGTGGMGGLGLAGWSGRGWLGEQFTEDTPSALLCSPASTLAATAPSCWNGAVKAASHQHGQNRQDPASPSFPWTLTLLLTALPSAALWPVLPWIPLLPHIDCFPSLSSCSLVCSDSVSSRQTWPSHGFGYHPQADPPQLSAAPGVGTDAFPLCHSCISIRMFCRYLPTHGVFCKGQFYPSNGTGICHYSIWGPGHRPDAPSFPWSLPKSSVSPCSASSSAPTTPTLVHATVNAGVRRPQLFPCSHALHIGQGSTRMPYSKPICGCHLPFKSSLKAIKMPPRSGAAPFCPVSQEHWSSLAPGISLCLPTPRSVGGPQPRGTPKSPVAAASTPGENNS